MENGHTGNIVIKSWILHIMRNDWNDINDIDFNHKQSLQFTRIETNGFYWI